MIKRALALFLVVASFCLALPISACVSDRCKDPANANDVSCIAENVIADCTGSDVSSVLAAAEPIIAAHIEHGVNPDGSINYDAIESDLVQDVIKFGECAVTDVWTKYFSSSSSKIAIAVNGSAAHPPTAAAAKEAFTKFRGKHFSKNKLKTNAGTL